MNIHSPVRVRFAPSPTGHLHIGSFRAALFNYLFARHHNGVYLLRIEDTDLERSKKEYAESIEHSLAWAQLLPDEPCLVQSARIKEHKALINILLNQKKAYRCYCTQQEVTKRYQVAHDTQDTFVKYDGACAQLTEQLDEPFVVRFKLPDDLSAVTFIDLIRGEVTFDREQLDDFIIARSDGTPTYNFVVVADDAFMRITHVIRGDDHISNTPKQIVLYRALEYRLPEFAHIPLILGPSGNKLSKRDAATSVADYIKNGYLPDAFINYLARLGWSHGNQEIFSRKELIQLFTLKHVGKKGAIFDQDKLDWVNGVYLREATKEEIYSYMIANVCTDLKRHISMWNMQTIYMLIDLYKDRCKTIKNLCDTLIAVYNPPKKFVLQEVNVWLKPDVVIQLNELVQMLEHMDSFRVDLIKDMIKAFCKERNLKLVTVAQPIRLALVGSTSSPGIFDLLAIIGQSESVKRLRTLLAHVKMQ